MSEKVVLYHVETGRRFERWPVDARDMLATGAYTTDTPAEAIDAVTVTASVEHVAPLENGAVMPNGVVIAVGDPSQGSVSAASPVLLSQHKRRR